jgi:superfamily II DNA or RNA helicase
MLPLIGGALIYVRRDPDKGYYGRQLWLPKDSINTRAVKAGLEFPVMDDKGISYVQLWEDVGTHLVVPREFIPREEFSKLDFPVISTTPPPPPRVDFVSRIVLDAKEPTKHLQKDAAEAMLRSHGGLLNLACGKGKTVLALYLIAKRKVPALVIVNNTTLINQWRERIEQYLEVPGGVGLIQGPPRGWDWEGRGVTLAMIHSLGLRHEELPEGIDRAFGLVIYDEVHHVSAPLFLPTAPLFYGERHGLTATTGREDGLEAMYQYHVGRVYFRDLTQDLKPRVYFQACDYRPNTNDPEVRAEISDKGGRPSIPRLRNYLGTRPECNEFIASKIQKALDSGRKVLALSHSVEQLRMLNSMFADSGLCTGREKPEDRLVTLRTKRVSFGTLQLVKEALDEDTLDTLFFLTSFGSSAIEEGGFNTLQQGFGRIQRYREGKKTPVVVFIDYIYAPKMHRMCTTLKKQLRNWPVDQGGPLEYTVIRPHAEEKIQ